MDSYAASEILKQKYLSIIAKGIVPEKAWTVKDTEGKSRLVLPPLPLVGEKYFYQPVGCRILLYGSAENFSKYGEKINDLCSEEWMDRSQIYFDATRNTEYYPNVHIQPINDGGLLLVAYQVAKRLLKSAFSSAFEGISPAMFIDRICCSNWCKYTLQTEDGNNLDYAGDSSLLKYSHDFLRADIEVLQPDIIIMPSTMYYCGSHCGKQKSQFFETYYGTEFPFRVVPVYQINARVVNTHIGSEKDIKGYEHLYSFDELSENERKWHEHIKRIDKSRFMAVYSYLDKLEKDGWE